MKNYKQLDQLPDYLVGPNGELYSKRNKKDKKWCINNTGYLVTMTVVNGKNSLLLQHRLVYAYYNSSFKIFEKTQFVIDHINSIKTDNRIDNLRLVSGRENVSKERRIKTNLPTGITSTKNGYKAAIQIRGKRHHLGVFNCADKAAEAYNTALLKYTNLNEIPLTLKERKKIWIC